MSFPSEKTGSAYANRALRIMDRKAVFALPRLKDSTIPPIGRRFFNYSSSQILKLGTKVDEAIMTELANKSLGDKAPRLDDIICLTDKEPITTGIIISRLPGKPLVEIWPSLNEAQRVRVKRHLAELIVFMREPRAGINYYGRPGLQPYKIPNDDCPEYKHDFCHTRLEWDTSRIRALHANSKDLKLSRKRVSALEKIQRTTGVGYAALFERPVLTHGDLSDRNILINPETLEVKGLIDWELANITPAYFEFIHARISQSHNPFWRKEILEVLEEVLRIECHRTIAQGNLENQQVTSEVLFRDTLAAWKALVNVERPAQRYSDACYWTFEEKDEETRKNWEWD